MLDAYIIDRIRREKERQQQIDRRLPLQIERPAFEPDELGERRDEQPAPERDDRGSVVIDYSV